jgi:predicted DNA-binding transcriptional regulator AlpA
MQPHPQGNQSLDALLTELEAAELLGLSTRTLQSWRMQETGPAYVRAGRAIRYRRRDLLTWIDSNTVRGTGTTDQRNA